MTWGQVVDGAVIAHETDYKIAAGKLRVAGSTLRTELGRLAEWSEVEDRLARREILTAIARAGKNVRTELFRAENRGPMEMSALKQWVDDEYEQGDQQLTIYSTDSVHVPWGLIFDADRPTGRNPQPANGVAGNAPPEPHDDLTDIEAEIKFFSRFWCLKRTLWITPIGYYSRRKRILGQHDSFGLISLFNQEVVEELVGANGEPQDVIGRRYMPPVGCASSQTECCKLIESASQSDLVFYYFGHHHNLELDLGNGERITYTEFGNLMDQLAERISELSASSLGLVFINGCASAVGDEEVSLRGAANKETLSGIIATEAIVPTRYAARFGRCFLDRLVEGVPVGEIMKGLYSTEGLWPCSLLYGYYAHPNYRVTRERPPSSVATTPAGARPVG